MPSTNRPGWAVLMRWNDSATVLASAVQMLTMPVATFSAVVDSKNGSANDNSAAGEPVTHSVPYPSRSISWACSGVTASPRSRKLLRGSQVNTPNRPRSMFDVVIGVLAVSMLAEPGRAHHDDHPVRGVVGSLSRWRGVGGRLVPAVALGDTPKEARRWIGLDALDVAAHFQIAVRIVGIRDRHGNPWVALYIAVLLPLGGMREPQQLAVPVEPHRAHLHRTVGPGRRQMPIQRPFKQVVVASGNRNHIAPIKVCSVPTIRGKSSSNVFRTKAVSPQGHSRWRGSRGG